MVTWGGSDSKGTGQPDLVVWWLGSAFSPHVLEADDRASRGRIEILTIIALDKHASCSVHLTFPGGMR